MRKLFKYYRGHAKSMIIAPLFKLVETATDIIIPMLIANMIDVGVTNQDVNYIITYGAIVIALNIVAIVCSIICQKFAAKAAVGVAYNIRKALFSHINTFSYAELDKFGTATLNNRLTHDVTQIRR